MKNTYYRDHAYLFAATYLLNICAAVANIIKPDFGNTIIALVGALGSAWFCFDAAQRYDKS